MDEYSGKRHIGGVVLSKKASNLVSRDMTEDTKRDAQFCNRIGCSGRLKYSKTAQVALTEKPKYSRPSFQSSNGKEIIGSSSGTNKRKSLRGCQSKISSHLETDSSESSSTQGDADVTEIIPSITRNETDIRQVNSSKVSLRELGSSSKSVKVFRRKPGSACQNVQPGPSVSSASNSINSGARSSSNGSRYGLKNLKCNSISDTIPQTGSPSESKVNRRDVKKRTPEGESSSSSRLKRSGGTTSQEGQVPVSTSGVSISCPRRVRNWDSNNDGNTASSSRARRSLNGNGRMTSSNRDDFNISLFNECTATISEVSQADAQIDTSVNSLSSQSNDSSSYSTPGNNSDNSPSIMPLTSVEHGVTHALRRYNLDGVAEMLMALERIEQDEELSYEQLLALETNLFLGSLHLYDQHRDMRLDIDNMSYEELLALEERMGTVNTAVPEEALAKCLAVTIYQNPPLEVGISEYGNDEDEMKCCICQEEYAIGDEMGKLECKHGYHSMCIQQWLRLKNWCPICKASVAPSSC